MDWTTDLFLTELKKNAHMERMKKLDSLEQDDRKSHLLFTLNRALGKLPEHPCPLQPVLMEQKDYSDFYMEKIAYHTMDNIRVPVIVLIPKDGAQAWPAVLACHGHGNGQLDAIGMDAAGTMLDHPGIHNRFAVELVRKGVLVVIPEIMGFGARRLTNDFDKNSSCATLAAHLLMLGKTLAGMRVYEARRAIDYIQTRNDVQHNKIGILGFSGGGLISAYTAALDERVRATVLCGWMNTFEGSILSRLHCTDNYLPALLPDAEQIDLTTLIAPRALFVEAGEQDTVFPLFSAEQAITQLEQHYHLLNARDQFAYHIHAGGHEIKGSKSFQWLADKLKK